MLQVALCLFLVAPTLGHTRHHYRKNSQLSSRNGTFISSKDTDWTIPDVKYLNNAKEMKKDLNEEIAHKKGDDSKDINTTTTTSVKMTTTTSKTFIEDVIKSGETPLNVQGVINAPIIVIHTAHHRRRYQHFKQPNSTEVPTFNFPKKQKVLPPVRPEHSINGGDKWNYDSTYLAKIPALSISVGKTKKVLPPVRLEHSINGGDKWNYDSTYLAKIPALSISVGKTYSGIPEYAVLNDGFIIADRNNDITPTIAHPVFIDIKHSPSERSTIIKNTAQYLNMPPPVPTLSPWYDGYGK